MNDINDPINYPEQGQSIRSAKGAHDETTCRIMGEQHIQQLRAQAVGLSVQRSKAFTDYQLLARAEAIYVYLTDGTLPPPNPTVVPANAEVIR